MHFCHLYFVFVSSWTDKLRFAFTVGHGWSGTVPHHHIQLLQRSSRHYSSLWCDRSGQFFSSSRTNIVYFTHSNRYRGFYSVFGVKPEPRFSQSIKIQQKSKEWKHVCHGLHDGFTCFNTSTTNVYITITILNHILDWFSTFQVVTIPTVMWIRFLHLPEIICFCVF